MVSAGWLAASNVSSTLVARARLASTNDCLWKGDLCAGTIEDLPAISSTSVPAGTLVHGVFDQLVVVEFSPIILRYTRHYNFNKVTSGLAAQMLVDVSIRNPAAFQALTGVT
jgi:hypothetical protein